MIKRVREGEALINGFNFLWENDEYSFWCGVVLCLWKCDVKFLVRWHKKNFVIFKKSTREGGRE